MVIIKIVDTCKYVKCSLEGYHSEQDRKLCISCIMNMVPIIIICIAVLLIAPYYI